MTQDRKRYLASFRDAWRSGVSTAVEFPVQAPFMAWVPWVIAPPARNAAFGDLLIRRA